MRRSSVHDIHQHHHQRRGSSSEPTSVPYYARVTTTGSTPAPNMVIPQLSRKFVARRISEGETGRLKEELKCQACGKGYKHVSSLAKHLWEHTPEWNVTSKLLISKHQQVQLLEAASILVSMNEEDEDEEAKEPAFIVDNPQAAATAQAATVAQSAPAKPGMANYMTSANLPPAPPQSPLPTSLTPAPTSSSESASPSPPPSTMPHTPSIPMVSNARVISKPSPYAGRRSSLSAYPPSSWGRRGSTPGTNLSMTPSRSPVTDSLFVPESVRQSVSSSLSTVRMLDEYDGLASPNRARRLSNIRASRPDDLFDDDDPVGSRPSLSAPQKLSHDRNDSASHSVFGDMDD